MGAIAIVVFIVICLAYNHYTFNLIEKAGIGIVELSKKKIPRKKDNRS
jgi:hypothetical protein